MSYAQDSASGIQSWIANKIWSDEDESDDTTLIDDMLEVKQPMLKRLWQSEKKAFFKAVQVFDQTSQHLNDLELESIDSGNYEFDFKVANVNSVVDSLS